MSIQMRRRPLFCRRHTFWCRPRLELLEDRTLPSGLFSNPIISTNAGGDSTAIATGNFINGDSRPDVVALNGGRSHDLMLALFVSDAQGHLTPAGSPIDTGISAYVSGLVTGDFNGDGNLDLAFVANVLDSQGNVTRGEIEIWLGNGAGTFTQAPGSPILAYGAEGMVAANLNGHLDLAAADYSNITVLLNDGTGNFTAKSVPTGLGGGALGAFAVAAGDFNGDEKMDLAVTNVEGNQVNVFLGDGQGNFQAAPNGPYQCYALPGGPDGLQAGEFDGDNSLDLAVVGDDGYTGGYVTVLKGDGTGKAVQQPSTFLGTTTGATDVVIADFNGDHKPDLFLTDAVASSRTASVLLGDGNDGFTDGGPVNVTPEKWLPGYPSVAVADFNGDGKPDVVLADGQGNLDVLLTQSGVQVATTTSLQSWANPSVAGMPVTLTATVTPTQASSLTPTGSVTFSTTPMTTVQTVPLGSNGQAVMAETLAEGSYTISAAYSGDSNFPPSNSPVLTQTVRTAKTFVWSGLGPDNTWSDPANWVGGVAPAPGDLLVFPSGAAQESNVNDYPAGSIFNAILFTQSSGSTSPAAYRISGNAITLGPGGIMDQATSSANDISFPIGLGSSASFITVQNSAAALELDGQIDNTPDEPMTGIVKSGAGILVLAGDNIYGGPTLITRGQLDVANAMALGTGQTVVRAGAVLGLIQQTATAAPLVITNSLVLAGTLMTGDLTAPATWAGPIELVGPAATFAPGGNTDASSTLIAGGTITGSGSLAMQGVGTLVLTGSNAYTGATRVAAGTIELTNPAGLGAAAHGASVANGAMLAVSGGINVAVNVTLAPDGRLGSLGGDNTWSGTVTLTGEKQGTIEVDADQLTITGVVTESSVRRIAAGLLKTGIGTLFLLQKNAFTGGIHVANGVLEVHNGAALGRGNIQVSAGGTLALDPTAPRMGPPPLFVFTQRLSLMGSGFENQGALELLSRNVTWAGAVQLNDVACIATTGSNVLTMQGAIGGDSLMVTGTGDVQLSGSNTYTGATFVLGGDLDVLNAQALAATGEGVTVAAGAALRLFASLNSALPLNLLDQSQLAVMTTTYWNGPMHYAGFAQVVVSPKARLYFGALLTGTSGARLDETGGGSLILVPFSGVGQTTFAPVLGPDPLIGNQIQVDSGLLFLAFDIPHSLGASLQPSLAARFTPAIGQAFTITHSTSANPNQGAFAGLNEGGTFTVAGFTFQITYKGGAGNDVVVTRVA
jgi:autotransporter-associated beta strand protein